MNSLHKGPVTRNMFLFDDAIMWYCPGLDGLYLAPPCTWTESNCYSCTRPSKSCRVPRCTFEHTPHCRPHCPHRLSIHLHQTSVPQQTPAHPGSISHTAVNFCPPNGSSDLWKKKWGSWPLVESPVFCWSSAGNSSAPSVAYICRWTGRLFSAKPLP